MEYNFSQKAYHILHYNHQITDFPGEPVLTFKAVFEERSDFHRSYTLLFNTLVAVLDDGNSDSGTKAALMTVSGCSVKETAALNFSNEFYFSRFFKRRVGCAPSEYRNRFLTDRNTGRPGPVIIP